jgi:hypothetical protein
LEQGVLGTPKIWDRVSPGNLARVSNLWRDTEDNSLELLNFLQILEKGFVTDKMRGCYEHSLTLQEIVDGVAKYNGYRIVSPLQAVFVVAGCTDHGSTL